MRGFGGCSARRDWGHSHAASGPESCLWWPFLCGHWLFSFVATCRTVCVGGAGLRPSGGHWCAVGAPEEAWSNRGTRGRCGRSWGGVERCGGSLERCECAQRCGKGQSVREGVERRGRSWRRPGVLRVPMGRPEAPWVCKGEVMWSPTARHGASWVVSEEASDEVDAHGWFFVAVAYLATQHRECCSRRVCAMCSFGNQDPGFNLFSYLAA